MPPQKLTQLLAAGNVLNGPPPDALMYIVDDPSGTPISKTITTFNLLGSVNVKGYGAKGDGVADDTTAIQAAIDVAKAMSGVKDCRSVLEFPYGLYKVTGSLDFTDTAELIVEGNHSLIVSYATNKVALDFLGSARCMLRNLCIKGDSANIPKVGFSFGRSTSAGGEDSGHNLLDNVQITGAFSIAGIYDVCSEINSLRHVWIYIDAPTTVKYGIYFSSVNGEAIGSDFAARSATVSAACIWIQNVNIGTPNTATQFIPIYLEDCGGVTVRDSYVFTWNSMPSIKTYGNILGLMIDNVLVEGIVGNVLHLAAKAGAGAQRDVSITNTGIQPYISNLVLQDAGTICTGLKIENCNGATAAVTSNITLNGTVYGAFISKWYSADAGTVALNAFYDGYLNVSYHTVTVAASDNGSQILYGKSDSSGFVRLPSIKVGINTDTTLARVTKIMTATAAWNPNIADGAEDSISFVCAGVLEGDVVVASLGLGTKNLIVTAEAFGGGGWVNVYNRTGGVWAPGAITVTILAFKVG